MRKPPCPSLTADRVRLVSVQTALTVAPGRTAPVESATVPVMSPVVFCAKTAGAEAKVRSTPRTTKALGRSISPPRLRKSSKDAAFVDCQGWAVKHSYAKGSGKSAAIQRNEAEAGGDTRDDADDADDIDDIDDIDHWAPACPDHRLRGASVRQDRRPRRRPWRAPRGAGATRMGRHRRHSEVPWRRRRHCSRTVS